jgi:hypothetical protein
LNLTAIQDALQSGSGVDNPEQWLFTEARDGRRWDTMKTSPAFQAMAGEVRHNAARYASLPIKALPYSRFKLFKETGSRKEYEAEYFEHRDRMNTFALMSLLDGALEYREALEDIIWAICDEYTWCLPAHLPDDPPDIGTDSPLIYQSGTGLPTEQLPQHTLDLFASETAFSLAEITSLLKERLSPPVVRRARQEIFRRVLDPYRNLITPLWWETAPMNWAAVCAGSIGAAALYLLKEASVLAPLLERVLATLDCYLLGFGTDGASTEGIGYWAYGFGFYVYFAALLQQRTQGKIDLFQREKINKIALFQQKCYLWQNRVVSFSDASSRENYLPGLTHYLKNIYPELEIPDPAYRAKLGDVTSRRWANVVRNFIWLEPGHPTGLTPECSVYLPDAQWLIVKQPHEDDLICFAAKGGHNDEPHNHNDIGSFLLCRGDQEFLADLGRNEYTRQYFREERYQYLCAGSQGHSVPVVAGAYQKQGLQYAARMVECDTAAETVRFSLDISHAYGVDGLQSLRRQFCFHRTTAELRLEDRFEFAAAPVPVLERLVTRIPPQIIDNQRVRLNATGKTLEIRLDGDVQLLTVHSEDYIAHDLSKNEVFFIDFHFQPRQAVLTANILFSFS